MSLEQPPLTRAVLSVLNGKLLTQAFKLKEQCTWKYIWADPKGNIKARRTDNSDIINIKCTDDIYEADDGIQISAPLEQSIFC